ncbi:uncharacterized protein L203_102840 [Cryptococcus depauperatus CBS 7841]|uniref:Uncharacterized protein n=1 Tax=Cryptococcus depauperatus CBS 7841 TaxID=1295531 RepID=A0A1E3IB19_9TREE|nr:hypothetical protein L203_04643 [Cryptococcus depauperatus CBS 7841]
MASDTDPPAAAVNSAVMTEPMPPPAVPLKKKFTSVNLNQKFLSKATSPASASGTVKPPNGRQSASPVPIASSSSRHLSTKLVTVPVVKPAASPNSTPPTSSASPWATPSAQNNATQLHQPAPIAAASAAGVSNVASVNKMAWKTPTMTAGRPLGIARDFPTAKEVADGQKAAQLVAQAQAAHNQAILQELHSFTRIDPHSHRWDEEDEDDIIDFPDMPTQPVAPSETQDEPVPKSERFAQDYDRSWPRREGASDWVLYDAKTDRLDSRPMGTTNERPVAGERGAWGPRLMRREEKEAEVLRGVPPHLPQTGSKPGEAPAGSGLPTRSAWGPRAGTSGAKEGEWREHRERSSTTARPNLPPVPVHPLPAHPNMSSAAPSSNQPPSTDSLDDPQAAEMHNAAEKARLRRLEEEKEREAAKERARMKAKMLEEKSKASSGKDVKSDKSAATQIATTQIEERRYTLAQRPKDVHSVILTEPSKAESELSWRARASHLQTKLPESDNENRKGKQSLRSTVRVEPPDLARKEASTTDVSPETQPARNISPSSSPQLFQQSLHSTSPALPITKVDYSTSALDGMMAQIKAAMKQMQEAREKGQNSQSVSEEEFGEVEQDEDVKVESVQNSKSSHGPEKEKVEVRKEKQETPTPTELRANLKTQTSQQAKHTLALAQTPPIKSTASPAAALKVPEFFDISYPPPPPSPPPAWRTFTVRIPKLSPSVPSLSPISVTQLKAWEAGGATPRGWAFTFTSPFGVEGYDRAEWLLPQPRVMTKKGEVVVSISPRVLERVKERRRGIDGEVHEDASGTSKLEQNHVKWDSEVQAALQAPLRRKSPVKSAAQAEKEGTFLLQPVRLAIPPPPHIIPILPSAATVDIHNPAAGNERVPSSTDRVDELNRGQVTSMASEDGKQGVRFMVSSELEGDKLLEEVNRVSLESVEEDGKEDETKVPQTGQSSSPDPTTHPAMSWSKQVPFNHTPRSSQHDAIKSVWDSSDVPQSTDTPMYPTLNAPSPSDPQSQGTLATTNLQGGFSQHSSVSMSSQTAATQFSPNLSSGVSFNRHPSTHSQQSHAQVPSPYFTPHSLTSPDPSLSAGILPGYNRPSPVPAGVGGMVSGVNVGNGGTVAVNGFQQGVWGGFASPMAAGYGYNQLSQSHHQTHQPQGAQQSVGQKGYLPQHQYNPNPYNRPLGYAYNSSPQSFDSSSQVRPQGRFAQANGDYHHQRLTHAHAQSGQSATFGMTVDGPNQGFYGGVSAARGGVYTAQPQSQQHQHPTNQQQGGQQQGGYGRGSIGRGVGRKMW